MDGYATYDEATRRRAAALFDEGLGYKAAASLLGIPRETVRKWLDIYRSVGIEVLAMMGKKHTAYPFETKLGAVRARLSGRSPREGRGGPAPRPGRRRASRNSSGGSGSSRRRTPT